VQVLYTINRYIFKVKQKFTQSRLCRFSNVKRVLISTSKSVLPSTTSFLCRFERRDACTNFENHDYCEMKRDGKVIVMSLRIDPSCELWKDFWIRQQHERRKAAWQGGEATDKQSRLTEGEARWEEDWVDARVRPLSLPLSRLSRAFKTRNCVFAGTEIHYVYTHIYIYVYTHIRISIKGID